MRRKGFSLIEVMIVVALFGLLFSAVFGILAANRVSWDIGSTTQLLFEEARRGMDQMVKELYNTNSAHVTISDSESTITFQVPVGSDDTTGNILWGAEGAEQQYIQYKIFDSQLLRTIVDSSSNPVGEMTPKILANYVQNLTFSLNNSLLTITLTTQKTALGGNTLTQTLSSKLVFRN